MDNNKEQDKLLQEEEQIFSLRDFLMSCMRKWQWFLASLIVCLGFGVFYALKQEPVYQREMLVLISDNDPGGNDMSAFSITNPFSKNTKVNNELISMKAAAVMADVVKRLDLTKHYEKQGLFHPTTLYGKNNPLIVTMPDVGLDKSAGFTLELQPNGSGKMTRFWQATHDGVKEYDEEVSCQLGSATVRTPIGRVTLTDNPLYAGAREKEAVKIDIFQSDFQGTVENYINSLKGDLEDQDADVINLSIEDVNIERADDILTNVVKVYNERWVTDKNRLAVATSDFITERLNLIERELGNVDEDISLFKSHNKLPDVEAVVTQKLSEASEVNLQLSKLRNEMSMTQYVLEYMQDPAHINDVIPVNVGIEDPTLSMTVSQYNTLLLEYQMMVRNSSADNPLAKEYEHRVRRMRESVLQSVKNRLGALQAGLRDIRREQGTQDNELERAPLQAKQLLSIERQQKVKEELYIFLLQKREENELSQTFTAYNTRVLTPPWGPGAPISPKKKLILIIAFFIGVGFPAAMVYLIEANDRKIRSRKDLENIQIPFAGEIPFVGKRHRIRSLLRSHKQKQKEIDTPKPVVEEGKRDIPNEAFRVVRSNIDLMLGKEKKSHVLMLTSFNPGSGKSFIVYNLGVSFALKGNRVLLIDCDLRHGSLSYYAGKNSKGLSNYLTESTDDWRSLTVKGVQMPNLDIMPIGHRPPNPAELLGNGRLKNFLDQARQNYDIIILDCPPVNIVVDTQLIEPYSDRTIFVVRAGLLEKSAIRELTNLYLSGKYKHMSLLLNGTQTAHSSYHSYGNYASYEKV